MRAVPRVLPGLLLVCASVAGCSADDDGPVLVPPTTEPPAPLSDPWTFLSDPDHPEHLEDARLITSQRGRGPATVPLRYPEGARGVEVYVTCAPDAHYKVTWGSWFDAGCDGDSLTSGGFSRDISGAATELVLDIDDDTERWLTVVAVG